MKRILSAALAIFCLSFASHAQNTTAQPSMDPQTQKTERQSAQSGPAQGQTQAGTPSPRIAPGSIIPVQLTKTVDAKKIKSGDEVQTQVTQDLKTNSGEVIVPKGTKVLGHVTSAQPHSKEQKESELGIAFDHAVLKNGTEMNLPLSIEAVIAPPSANPGNAGNEQPPSNQAGGMQPGGGGRSPGMAGNQGSSQGPPTPSAGSEANETQASNSRGPITANTKGVVGIPNLTLTAASTSSGQGSVLSSEKNNVKLESGTMLLLRVNQ